MKRKTIKSPVSLSGVGLHTGKTCTMTLKPAECGSGIQFHLQKNGTKSKVKAEVAKVVDTARHTAIGSADVSVHTVEHLLSAAYASGVDDLTVEMDGNEVPIMDGSARAFSELLREAGIEESEKEKDYFVVDEFLEFKHEESGAEYIILPHDGLDIQVNIEYEDPISIYQSARLKDLSEFDAQIADSRTFVFASEVKKLLDAGLIKGGSIENAIVINDGSLTDSQLNQLGESFGIHNVTEVLKYNPHNDNALAKHKLLDLIGDLSLLARPIKAKIIATQPGHTANIELTKFLKANYLEKRKLKGKPIYDPTIDPLYDLEGIKKLIPHRYPFLMVDKIIELTESKVVGIKNVTINEHFFTGHFPDNPVFPGVLQLEALAQTGGILVLSQVEDPENYNTYFMKIDNVKFKQLVVPGDTMILKMELLSPIRRGIVHMQGTVYVGNKIVSQSELTAHISKKENAK